MAVLAAPGPLTRLLAVRGGRIDREHLTAIRGDFDSLLQDRFREWDLNPAETDVALLTIRGIKIVDIARIRHAHDGTVKSQRSTI